METKINIAELLKDCPKGMELYSPIYGLGNLTKVTDRIHVKFPKEHNVKCFRLDGKVSENGEVMIFPKGKTTWEGFVPPCKFKDGDVLSYQYKDYKNRTIYIYMQHSRMNTTYYVALSGNDNSKFMVNDEEGRALNSYNKSVRLATEEEKEKLFKAIKDNGYKWNAETKTLEKLVEPIFEVGNKIEKCGYRFTIAEVKDDYYLTKCGNKIPIDNQDDFSLVPNKFDLTTLKTFDEVLVRDGDTYVWEAHLFSRYYKNSDKPYICIGVEVLNEYRQCIPYDSNKELLGTTDDCDNYYKTW